MNHKNHSSDSSYDIIKAHGGYPVPIATCLPAGTVGSYRKKVETKDSEGLPDREAQDLLLNCQYNNCS